MRFDKLTKIVLGVSAIVGTWAIYQIFANQQYLQGGVLLAYVGVVIFAMLKIQGPKNVMDSVAQKTIEEKVLDVIRERGQAKRHDLMVTTGLSRSSLGRLLDGMEKKRLIEQHGERKTSFYTLKMA
ncbi:MAG: hypothetical protein A3F82_09995 [Deltaproteobacteria bacterium RIFCSPLOWO2_12_FULL_44_12]|nr:MAG: hypothetical protein A2712_05085 [Deltaproteobacteria bacterium RIFCSPHIGHO2_01_FULL_43_49]OGQ15944.1 MAG: hypothetical protein A3D22_07755 [Deltaproteobacteria bacterium RIFCSPHIGHO2_02_FULL_44_53]OGQ29452.1 MAG: hypothetical protein A3D98_00075 [Deltaproteobacteria bacterium RIFCSPHIGHO2_12_FULL_44_21]OGQ30998.1 MAG: hypothetical protein A2979_02145 [Deltaproteobacteria bacterium RIFCSPLOWO2_01_FULL_45_74]OGQ44049.1 MAG: hypothetical protein A3I70_10445 [Deltaproteobacteria bacterium 